MAEQWLRVPIGPEAGRWVTGTSERVVLAVVHNVTSLTRLLDAVTAFDSDPRIQVLFTWTGSSPFTHDVERFLDDIGAMPVPWNQVTSMEFDLAISASYGGDLHEITAPLITISHGMGYNKKLPRNQGTKEPVFGLSRDWLLHDGRLLPASIVLSHPEQLKRLERDCPEAVPAAVIAGDPCYDRMLASVPHRRSYRESLGVSERRKLILVTSTWGSGSLFDSRKDLVPRLVAELPMDEYQVVVALHPNIWHGHSPWQVGSWLARAVRGGAILLPPRDGWRAALVAADLVIGDHGSVTFYGAALGRPVVLAAFPYEAVDADSPIAKLGTAAPPLSLTEPLLEQIDRAITEHAPSEFADVTASTTSVPGASSRLLRTEMYRLMDLDEPPFPPAVTRVPAPSGRDRPKVTAWLASVRWEADIVRMDRFPASVALDRPNAAAGRHLVVDEAEPEERLLELADVVLCGPSALDSPDEIFRRYPGCFLTAMASDPEESLVRTRDGAAVSCSGGRPAVAASAVYAWLARGCPLAELPSECIVIIGSVPSRLLLNVRS